MPRRRLIEMMVQLIDTHCHLDFDRFDEDRRNVVVRAKEAGLVQIIVPAVDLENMPAVLDLTEQFPGVLAAVGVHPNSASGWQENWLDKVKQSASHPHVVAIGEIGLDYYWDRTPPENQRAAFRDQLQLAAELDLPVIVHNRDATIDVLRLLAESPLAGRPRAGVLHSFSADRAAAADAVALGFYIGITGPVTFKKADELREIVATVPSDRLLIETDAPFLAPQPYRGKRNEPAYVRFVADAIAVIRESTVEEIAASTTANARRLFQLESKPSL